MENATESPSRRSQHPTRSSKRRPASNSSQAHGLTRPRARRNTSRSCSDSDAGSGSAVLRPALFRPGFTCSASTSTRRLVDGLRRVREDPLLARAQWAGGPVGPRVRSRRAAAGRCTPAVSKRVHSVCMCRRARASGRIAPGTWCLRRNAAARELGALAPRAACTATAARWRDTVQSTIASGSSDAVSRRTQMPPRMPLPAAGALASSTLSAGSGSRWRDFQ